MEQAKIRARALVFWGDKREEVVAFLVEEGLAESQAEEIVSEYFGERLLYVRRKGLHKMLTAVLFILPALWVIAFGEPLSQIGTLMLMLGLYGLWLMVGGAGDWLWPQKVRGDVSAGAFTRRLDG
ncbi:MAG: hypothetical protein JJT75_14225 [Opitutales bacterium]|nr:hypothetical protein [Opitutales bacterium]